MRKLSSVILIAILVMASSALSRLLAQQDWASKPFEQWTKSDAEAVLNNSKWTSHQEIRLRFDRDIQAAAGSANIVSSPGVEVDPDLPVDFIFLLRLRSALPIRQALVRLRQLDAHQKMSQKDQLSFDAQTKGMLECPACAANYVVTLSSKSTNRPGADAVYAVFKGGRLADLQRYIYIANENGNRRQLVHFVPPKAPGDEAVFFFPRLDDKGAPLLTVANRTLLVNLSDKQATSMGTFKIDVVNLIVNDKVEF
jgi:hypothetical protein